MRSTVMLRWFGWSAALAMLVVLDGTPAREPQPQPRQPAVPEAQAPTVRKSKHKAIPLQGLLRLAKESNNKFHKVDVSAYRELTELHLTTGQFTSPGASLQSTAEQPVPQTFELLCYNKQPVGPVILVRPGTTFKIRVHNDLDKGKPDPDPTGTLPGDIGATFEKPHGLCTTNLHTHGLHVSPAGDADDVFRLIEPKGHHTFTYTIKPDHPSGTYWYHPHKHGSVAYQLSNGLAGALIVEREKKTEPSNEGGPARYLEHVREIANAEEQVLVLQLYTYRVGPDKIGRIDASTVYITSATM